MHYHCGTNNGASRWTFTDSCKPEVRPGVREESAFPAWLAAPAMNARDTKGIYGGLTLDVDRHYIGSVTATTHQEKGIIKLESNPSRGIVLTAPHGKGNKCDKNVKYKRTDALSLWHPFVAEIELIKTKLFKETNSAEASLRFMRTLDFFQQVLF